MNVIDNNIWYILILLGANIIWITADFDEFNTCEKKLL